MKKEIGIMLVMSLIGLVGAHGDAGTEFYESHHGMMDGYYGSGMMGWMYGMGTFGWLIMALVILALILLIVWLIKELTKPQKRKRR